MFYPGMPDIYRYRDDENTYSVFWHEGEFYLGKQYRLHSFEEFEYFDDVNKLLIRMLKIAPYKDWKRISAEEYHS